VSGRVRVEDHLLLVKKLAGEVRRSLGNSVAIDDLIAYGNKGLVEAASRFDPSRGFAFSTFAYYRIKGAIYDGVREMGWRPRSRPEAKQVKFEAGANAALQQVADESQPGAASDAAAVENAIVQVAMVFSISHDTDAIQRQPDKSPDALAKVEADSDAVHVHAAIKTLPEKEKKLLELMYFEEKSLTDAGAAIGLSKSWACRLHARALRLMAEALEARGMESPQPARAGAR